MKTEIKKLMDDYWYEMRYPRPDKAKKLKQKIEQLKKKRAKEKDKHKPPYKLWE